MIKVTSLFIVLLLAASPLALPARQSRPAIYQEARRLMWTRFEIVAFGPDHARLAEAAEAAFEEIERLDRQMSNYSETSELTYINRNAARAEVIVEPELFGLLKLSFDYSRATGGAFDITIGPLMRAWGFFKGQGRLPAPKELKQIMATIGYKHVLLDERTRAVRFDREGIELDLGGIAKGYAVDKAAEILRASGVTSALVTAGGSSILAIGTPPDKGAWRVEVSDPADRSRAVTSIEIKDESISTSGCREKSFQVGGKSYCHIMDPRTGRPVEAIVSASVIAPRGVEAEALSKAVMVRGIEWSKEFLKKRPDTRAILYYNEPEKGLSSTRLNF